MGSPFFSETEFVEMGTGKVRLALDDGSLVEVIGSGTADPLISYYLLEMAERMGLDPQIDIYIPRDFSNLAPCAYAMCGGKFSEALIQNLVINGVNLLSSAVQMELDSYLLYMDVGTVRIDTPLQEKRIAAVTRSSPARAKSRICSGNAFLAISRVSSS